MVEDIAKCSACGKTFDGVFVCSEMKKLGISNARGRDEFYLWNELFLDYFRTGIKRLPIELQEEVNSLVQEAISINKEMDSDFDELERIWQNFIQSKGGEVSFESSLNFCKDCSQEIYEKDKKPYEKVEKNMKKIEEEGEALNQKMIEKMGQEKFSQLAKEAGEEWKEKHGDIDFNKEVKKLAKARFERIKSERKNSTSKINLTNSNDDSSKKDNTIYWVLGGLAGVSLAGAIAFWIFKKNKKERDK